MKPYIFFDLDRTLLPYDTMLLFCNYILRKERVRSLYLVIFLPAILLRFMGIISQLQFKRVFFSFLFRMRVPTLEKYSKDFVQETLRPLFFPELLALIKQHRDAGHFLVLNTASIEPYVKHIAKELGLTTYRATPFLLQDPMPLLPIIPKNNMGVEKIKAMSDILPKNISTLLAHSQSNVKTGINSKLPKIKSAHTYTDSLADLPLMELAESVTVVQPSQKKLEAMAHDKKEEENWSVLYPKRSIGFGQRFGTALCQILGLYSHRPCA